MITEERNIELKKLAVDFCEGKIYTSDCIPPEEFDREPTILGRIFMPLVFMSEEQRKEFVEKEIACIYAPLDSAMPRICNGVPSFSSCSMLNKEEHTEYWKHIENYRKQKEDFLTK